MVGYYPLMKIKELTYILRQIQLNLLETRLINLGELSISLIQMKVGLLY